MSNTKLDVLASRQLFMLSSRVDGWLCQMLWFQARRFITLIDELYNHHCRLYCSAACSIDDLFQGTEEGTLFDMERQVLASHFVNFFGKCQFRP